LLVKERAKAKRAATPTAAAAAVAAERAAAPIRALGSTLAFHLGMRALRAPLFAAPARLIINTTFHNTHLNNGGEATTTATTATTLTITRRSTTATTTTTSRAATTKTTTTATTTNNDRLFDHANGEVLEGLSSPGRSQENRRRR